MGERNPNEYIHNFARTLAGKIGLNPRDWTDPKNWPAESRRYGMLLTGVRNEKVTYTEYRRVLARTLRHRYGLEVRREVAAQKLGLQGFMACCALAWANRTPESPKTTLLDVDDGRFSPSDGGKALVQTIAVHAVLAAMTDNLIADLKRLGVMLDWV